MMRMEEDSVAEGLPGGKVIQRRRTVSWESYSRQLHKVVSQINSRRYCFVRVIICFNSYGLIPSLLVESLYFPEQIVATPILQSNSQITLPFLLCEFYFIFSAVLYFVRYFSYSVLILLSLEYIADSNKIQFSTKSFLPATLDCCFQSFSAKRKEK